MTQRYQIAHNIVDPNDPQGRTIKEINSEIQHTIPLGTLVEVDSRYAEEHGCRLFVVNHSRDCDGTPLYDLSFKKDVQVKKPERFQDEMERIFFIKDSGSITRHFGADSLIVIKPTLKEST